MDVPGLGRTDAAIQGPEVLAVGQELGDTVLADARADVDPEQGLAADLRERLPVALVVGGPRGHDLADGRIGSTPPALDGCPSYVAFHDRASAAVSNVFHVLRPRIEATAANRFPGDTYPRPRLLRHFFPRC